MVFWSIKALGEELNAAQKEVWSVIENNWDKLKQGDLNAIEASIHDDALILYNNTDAPLRKDLIMGASSIWISDAHRRPVTYELIPYAIQLFGDISNVFYSYKWKAEGQYSGYGRILVS